MSMHKQAESALAPEWASIVSGNAELALSMVIGAGAPALRMDFDFKGGGGFVVARLVLRRAMPEDYAVRFRLRGCGPVNHLELKLIDATGQNVWRHVQKDLHPPLRWKRMRVDSRSIDFAWGPLSGARLSNLGSIEFALVAGEGGKGTMWIADVQIEDCGPSEPPRLSASSALPQCGAEHALLGSGWQPQPDDRHPWICIDSLQPRTIGGLIIDWR
ncbi:MAG: discoidin domain-containing protein, partial [Gammaproteobacteria bacterium]